ncbi:MAG: exosortase/archaeosortase family protein [Acidimicrobiales bacterium]
MTAVLPPLRTALARGVRLTMAVGLVALGAWLVVDAEAVRTVEATSSASVVGALTSSETYRAPGTSSFYWLMGTSEARGLRITSECSVAYVLGPLLAMCGLLSLLRRLPARRMVAAAAAGAALIACVNLLRISMVAVAVTRFPSDQAMWWWHVVIGSLVSLAGVGVGLALTTRVAFGGRGRPRRPHPGLEP